MVLVILFIPFSSDSAWKAAPVLQDSAHNVMVVIIYNI